MDARIPRARSDGKTSSLGEQRVQQVLADVATEIEAARLLAWRGTWMARRGIPMTAGQGSMSKLKGADVTVWGTSVLMDVVGPYAQTTDCPLEKWLRDAIARVQREHRLTGRGSGASVDGGGGPRNPIAAAAGVTAG